MKAEEGLMENGHKKEGKQIKKEGNVGHSRSSWGDSKAMIGKALIVNGILATKTK